MKLQLQGQSLRFRLDEAEFSKLLMSQAISNHTCIAGVSFSQTVRLGDVPYISCETHSGHWQLTLPQAAVVAYGERLPCREGLDFLLSAGQDESAQALCVTFEVDVRDSIRRRGVSHRPHTSADTVG